MAELLNKRIADKLMKIEGEVRGVKFKADANFIEAKKGKEGLARVEEELKNVGIPLKYKETAALKFYPLGWWAASELAMKETFGWKDDDFRQLGRFAVSDSLIVRLYMKFFHSIEALVNQAPAIWRKYFTVGELVVPEYSEEKRYVILRIKGFNLHPTFCRFMEGYFAEITGMVVKSEKVRCQETRCAFNKSDCHEFKTTWA